MLHLRLDPLGGISGDMLLATLVDLGAPLNAIIHELQKLDLGQDFRVESEHTTNRGFAGLRLKVQLKHDGTWEAPEHQHAHEAGHSHDHTHEHSHDPTHETGHSHGHGHQHSHDHEHSQEHRTFSMIESMLKGSHLPPNTIQKAIEVFHELALAEGAVHGKPAQDVHFHEVGAVDSIVDIVGSCYALELLGIDSISSSAIGIANGQVLCAHGQLPLPAPATQRLLIGCPVVHQNETRELCTPTGAALLKALASFSSPPAGLIAQKVGMGLSHRTPRSAPPFLRGTLYQESHDDLTPNSDHDGQELDILNDFAQEHDLKQETVSRLSCHIDDMEPEYLPHLQKLLLESGALDVTLTPCLMKKGRSGHELSVLVREELASTCLDLILKHSSTFGCRHERIERFVLKREMKSVETPWGVVNVKISNHSRWAKYHIEYDDVAKISQREGLPWHHVLDFVRSKL